MNKITLPKHDINKLFDKLYEIVKVGDCADNCADELKFLNSLFAALPAPAIEEFMRFLVDGIKPSADCEEIMPLFIRLINLTTYCDKICELRDLTISSDMKIISKRAALNEELDNLEEPFGKNLLGYSFKTACDNNPPWQSGVTSCEAVPSKTSASSVTLGSSGASGSSDSAEPKPNNGSGLLLMNGSALIFPCPDIYKTSLFYEKKLGFSAVFLDDEAMPHIRLTRDNIIINLVQIEENIASAFAPMRELYGIKYDAYIYASEPLLLMNELKSSEVEIVKELDSQFSDSNINREFVFADCDGRHICVSQCLNIDALLGFA